MLYVCQKLHRVIPTRHTAATDFATIVTHENDTQKDINPNEIQLGNLAPVVILTGLTMLKACATIAIGKILTLRCDMPIAILSGNIAHAGCAIRVTRKPFRPTPISAENIIRIGQIEKRGNAANYLNNTVFRFLNMTISYDDKGEFALFVRA